MPSSYALLLTGPWGSGKTHFLKYQVFPKIEELKVVSGKGNYKPVLLSLYGVSNLKDLQDQIFFKCYGIGGDIGKSIFDFLKSIRKSGTVINSLTGLVNSLNLKKLVLCFDDLERMPPILLPEVIGFINDLTENKEVKCIILANEEKIDGWDKFNDFKEKTLGLVINYTPG